MTGAEAPNSSNLHACASRKRLARESSHDGDATERGFARLAIALSDRTSLFTLDERVVVFAEASQAVYEPNISAAAIFAYLRTPRDLPSLYSDLPNLVPGGPAEVERLLVDWSSAGLIDVFLEPEVLSMRADRQIHIPLGDKTASVHVYGEDLGWVQNYSRTPSSSSDGLITYVWSFEGIGIIKVGDCPTRIVHKRHIASSLRFLLVDYVLKRTEHIAIHAACICAGDRAVLLLGEPGAGKSTLAMFASECGMRLAGDDIALFDPTTGSVIPLALPLTLKEGSWSRWGATSWSNSESLPFERQDGVGVMYLPLEDDMPRSPLKISGMILLNRGTTESATLSHWTKVDCLRHVCSEAKSMSGKATVSDIGALVSVIANAETLVISYADAAEAGKLLSAHFAE